MNLLNQFSIIDFIKLNSKKISPDNPNQYKREIELITQKVLGCTRVDLYTKKDLYINQKDIKIISDYINRLQNGEPVQYILQQAYFYGRTFYVNNTVLIPRFDSELIIDILKKHPICDKLLDIGTGSGNLAITIAEENMAHNIWATDIGENKLSVAEHNKQTLSPKSNIQFMIDDFLDSKITQQFDIIVSNPPYIPQNQIKNLNSLVSLHEPLDSLTDGKDGYAFYKEFALIGNNMLKDGGFMLLEIGVDNKLKELYNIFSNYSIEVFNDLNNIPRVIKIF